MLNTLYLVEILRQAIYSYYHCMTTRDFFVDLLCSQFENSSLPSRHTQQKKDMFPNSVQIKQCSSLSLTLMIKVSWCQCEEKFEGMQVCHTEMSKCYLLTQSRGSLSQKSLTHK